MISSSRLERVFIVSYRHQIWHDRPLKRVRPLWSDRPLSSVENEGPTALIFAYRQIWASKLSYGPYGNMSSWTYELLRTRSSRSSVKERPPFWSESVSI